MVRDIGKGEAAILQEVDDMLACVILNPVHSAFAGELHTDFIEVLGRQVQLGGKVCYFPVLLTLLLNGSKKA